MPRSNNLYKKYYSQIFESEIDKVELSDQDFNRILIKRFFVSKEAKTEFFRNYESSLEEYFEKNKLEKTRFARKVIIKTIDESNGRVDYDLIVPLNHEENLRNTKSYTAVSPKGAQYFISLFLSRDKRENILGDLEEEFLTEIYPKYGAKRAWFWYWTQVVGSVIPILVERCAKLLGVLFGITKFLDWLQKRTGS